MTAALTTSARRTAFVFPGQGSQHVGMGMHLLHECPPLGARFFRTADEVLGMPLTRLCREGPAAVLRDTSITQPAVFLVSVATCHLLREREVEPDVVAGHSLGEYAALVSAGVLEWTDALRLVRRRGELMAAVSAATPGLMVAVLGMDVASVEPLCAEIASFTGRVVEVANDNEPGQVVVAGHAGPVRELARAAEAAGATKVVDLDVGAPFHCSLMGELAEEYARELGTVAFSSPRLPLISTVTADRVSTAQDAVELLRRQLTGRVRWTETVRRLVGSGVERVVEVGPGRVLSGLCRRTAPDARVLPTNDERRLATALDDLTPVHPA